MTQTYAVISDGIVENIIVAEEGFVIEGKILVSAEGAGIGYSWDGSTFTAPAPEPITSVQVDEERDARIQAGFIFNGVEYQSRLQDQKRIAGAGTLALGAIVQGVQPGNFMWHGGAEEFQWIAADDSLVKMDAHTTLAFGAAAARHESLHVFHGKALKNMDPIPQDYKDDKYWP